MRCGCGNDTRVVDSRPAGDAVRRRRVCEHCGTRTTTWETTTPPPKPPKPPVDEREREIKRQLRLARQAVLKRRRIEAMTPEQRAEMRYREKLRRAPKTPEQLAETRHREKLRREAMTPEQRAEMRYRRKLRHAGVKPTSQ